MPWFATSLEELWIQNRLGVRLASPSRKKLLTTETITATPNVVKLWHILRTIVSSFTQSIVNSSGCSATSLIEWMTVEETQSLEHPFMGETRGK